MDGKIESQVLCSEQGESYVKLNETVQALLTFSFFSHQLRVIWYTCMALAEDEDLQSRGVVSVAITERDGDLRTIMKAPAVLYSVPIRFEANHICTEKPTAAKLIDSALAFFAPNKRRPRLRAHGGTYQGRPRCRWRHSEPIDRC